MGDRSAEWAGLRTLYIYVDPLMVASRVGENIYLFLCNREVVGKSEMLSDQALEFVNAFYY